VTAACGGGASQVKPGYVDTVTLNSTGIEAALLTFGQPELAASVAILIGTITLYLPTFCSTDPPADPGLTSTDLLDALNFLDPATSLPAITRIKDWFLHQYWGQVCECVTGTASLGTPSNPGPLGTNSGIPTQPNAPCFTKTYTQTSPAPASGSVTTDITAQLVPVSGTSITRTGSIGGSGRTLTAWPVDPTITRIHFDAQEISRDPNSPGGNNALNVNWITWDSGGTQLDDVGLIQVGGAGSVTWSTTIVKGVTGFWTSTATHYAIAANINHLAGATLTQAAELTSTGTCTGNPLLAECCPPDPTVTSKLSQLEGLLLSIYQSLPTPITSLSAGTAHAGLTDNGSFSIAGTTIAVRIDVTTLPAYLGVALGDPLFHFDLGYITAAGAEGPYASERVTFSQQVFWLPAVSATIHYSLAPGAVVTITELSRGP
jgi:hypothetical protein